MKNIIFLFSLLILLVSCSSIDKYNKQLTVLRSAQQLQEDVDYIHRKLEKLHPDLYWYITKAELDFKFDSLKSSIQSPMTSNEFFFKISPVISSIRQGHMRVYPLTEKFRQKEKIVLQRNGPTPLSNFEFELFNDKLFIIKNNSFDKSISVGTELVTVNDRKPQEYFTKYLHTFSSDGFNQTYIRRKLNKGFPSLFYYQNGKADSVLCQLKYNDTIRTLFLKSKPGKAIASITKPTKQPVVDKTEKRKRRILGYNPSSKTYSKNLSYLEPDSSVALLKITDFTKGYYRKFYRTSFKELKEHHTRTIILDLRDNLGGKLNDVHNLYSYLSDSNFCFIDKSEVVSKTSLLHTNNFNGSSLLRKTLFIVSYPTQLIYMGIILTSVRKDENHKYYFPYPESRLSRPKRNNFTGKIYVLINGTSFSASCIISSNLKGSKKATFVGEETGGAYNGCIAGLMPVFTLPNSKLPVIFGLLSIIPHYKTATDGHGIFPDVEIIPTLEDRLKGNDPELKWVLDDIDGCHLPNP